MLEQRVEIVRAILLRRGVAPERVVVRASGDGPAEPGPPRRSTKRPTEPGKHGWLAGASLARQVVRAADGWRAEPSVLNTLADLIDNLAGRGQDPAVIGADAGTWSRDQLRQDALRFAAGLASLGVRPGRQWACSRRASRNG